MCVVNCNAVLNKMLPEVQKLQGDYFHKDGDAH